MREWIEPADLDRQMELEEKLGRGLRAVARALRRAGGGLGRYLRDEMGFHVRWRFCFGTALLVFGIVFLLWLINAAGLAISGVQ